MRFAFIAKHRGMAGIVALRGTRGLAQWISCLAWPGTLGACEE